MNDIKNKLLFMSGRTNPKSSFQDLIISPNGPQKYSILHKELCEFFITLYDKEIDKLDWLKRELSQLEHLSIKVFLNEDDEFNELYNKSRFKFDAIPVYFQYKKYNNYFDLSLFIKTMFNRGDDTLRIALVHFMCRSSAVFTALKKNQDTLDLILLVVEYFYKLDMGDGDFIIEVNDYVSSECTPREIEWMKKASPVYFTSFYNRQCFIED
ncbi:hypothetical protein QNH98_05710 [Myroides sp. mNGS23_01]|nr:hypothetical protein [Myroides sp. mNGS23_01]WHT40119.1 hypothetical protein QNH98_05710 [Myroides sp. mNGS23_01]